jgi:catechol 2,3-dioxygenase-like lactoylglutathione lyase family enzyme
MRWERLVPELSVSDFDLSLKFYVEVLEFSILFERPSFAYLERECAQLMIESAKGAWLTGELAAPFGRGINIQIECVDAAAFRDRLVERGVPLWRDLEDAWRQTGDEMSGAREFLVQDPDGYLLRFAETLATAT